MENFIFQNPTKLVFGKGTIARLGELIPAGKRVMVTFGGGSVRRNGVYDEVCAALAGRDTVEFWGIEPNPSIETLREAIALGKEREVDFLLAVGGGSVIDSAKAIAVGAHYDGDVWDFFETKQQTDDVLPIAVVLGVPMDAMLEGVTIENAKYELTNGTVTRVGMISTSNEAKPNSRFAVTIERGTALIIFSRDRVL